MRETKLASKVIHEWRTYPYVFVINIAGSQFQQPGLPDCLIIASGLHIFVEFKGPDTPVQKNQQILQKKLKAAGASVHELRFLQEDKEWIIDWYWKIPFGTFKEGAYLAFQRLIVLAGE